MGDHAPHAGGDAHRKDGAHHAHHAKDARTVVCAIVTVSDTRTPPSDTSGAEIRRQLEAAGHAIDDYRIVADDPALVRRAVEELAAGGHVEVVLLSGGTGIAARDNTFEAVSSLLTKRIDGFGELFRMLSFDEIGSAAMISRAVGGLVGTMALFSMPGSTAACRLAMEKLVIPQLAHVVGLARPRG
jgi:molybdenum cofactor biosynthesis protein B